MNLEEALNKITELESALELANKPRISQGPWFSGYDYLTAMPSDLIDDDRHPDVRAYDSLKERLDMVAKSGKGARDNFNKCADILDKAILCVLRNDCDDAEIIDEYRQFMNDIRGSLR